jgi:hypothetical protein
MYKFSLLFTIVLCLGLVGVSLAQTSTDERTRELVASLDKTKYKKKEKANVSIEVYVDVKNEPAVRSDKSEYSGLYDSDTANGRLQLTVNKDGTASGSGTEISIDSGKSVSFSLKNARVDGALLITTKVYEDGRTEPLEAVFVNRTTRSGKSPDAIATTETQFGIGWVESIGEMQTRVFLKKR